MLVARSSSSSSWNELEFIEDERAVINLNPKFAAMRRLSIETMERETKCCFFKVRIKVKKKENNKIRE